MSGVAEGAAIEGRGFGMASGTLVESPAKAGLFLACSPLDTCVIDRDNRADPIDPAGVDLTLLASGRAPVLADHSAWLGDVLGVVAEAWLEERAVFLLLRFAPIGRGAEVAELVRAGILRSVSLGALVCSTNADGVVRSFRPYEVSVVAVPRRWRAHIRGAATGERVAALLGYVADAAERADGPWRDWPRRAAPSLAARLGVSTDEAAAALEEVMAEELAARRDGAVAAKRRDLGLD